MMRSQLFLFILAFSIRSRVHSFHSYPSFRVRRKNALCMSKNNVVLRPSTTNTKAFDSLKIGSARVHRYENEESLDDSKYVMWYHGRCIEEKEKKLPPLSTGQIGYATSRNGLHWKKCSEICLSQNEDWWGFDTAHIGLGQVLLPSTSDLVKTPNQVYLMYYMGGNKEETTLSKYLPNVEGTIMGMKMSIGVAISQDGVHWARVEGDDPSGAIITPNDDEELYCAWPDVVHYKEKYLMYYSAMIQGTNQKCIKFATSSDGFRWMKSEGSINPSLVEDEFGCARCHVFMNESKNSNDLEFFMFYDGISSKDKKHRILLATSKNGLQNWKKRGVVLDISDDKDAWDYAGVSSPHVIRLDDGTLRMYYIGQRSDGSSAVGVAKWDNDGGDYEFEREQAQFSFATETDLC